MLRDLAGTRGCWAKSAPTMTGSTSNPRRTMANISVAYILGDPKRETWTCGRRHARAERGAGGATQKIGESDGPVRAIACREFPGGWTGAKASRGNAVGTRPTELQSLRSTPASVYAAKHTRAAPPRGAVLLRGGRPHREAARLGSYADEAESPVQFHRRANLLIRMIGNRWFLSIAHPDKEAFLALTNPPPVPAMRRVALHASL